MNPSDITIASYNKNAEGYADKFMNFESYKEKITLFQKRYIKKNAAILDLGCGPGNNAKILHDKDTTCRITGVDLSEKMVELARQNAPLGDFDVLDIRDIHFNRRFDVIIASFCIVHLTDTDTSLLLKKISDHLTPGGALYLSFMEGKEKGFETTSFSKDNIFFNYYDRGRIKDMLKQNAITTVEESFEGYEEEDGSITTDVFIFARKNTYELGSQNRNYATGKP